MTEREDTIERIERVLSFTHKDSITVTIPRLTAERAVSMLKEQEAKQVIDIADSIEGVEVGKCPRCERTIMNKKSDPTRFCKFCGQAVKWE